MNTPFSDATGFTAARLLEKYAAPDQVVIGPVESATRLPAVRAGYADDDRTYPIHTPAAAWLSAAHFLDSGADNRKVASELKRALEEHRLSEEWERLALAADMNRRTKEAGAAPRKYALGDRYPIDTVDRVVRAAAYLTEHGDRFDHTERRKYAAAVAAELTPEAIDRLPADVVRRVEAEAGLGKLAADWAAALRARIVLANRPDGDPTAAAVLKAAAAAPPADPLALVADLRDLDRAAGWDLPDPIDAVVGTTPSAATKKLAAVVVAPSGSWYRRTDLDRVPDAVVAELFSGGAVPVWSNEKRAALLSDPATAAEFERALADHGVEPVEHAPTRTDWVALARTP